MSPREAEHWPRVPSDLPHGLAGAEVGDEVRVMCRERGISVGDRMLVEARSNGDVVLRNEHGRSARLPLPYAFFVQVENRDDASP